MAEKEKSAGGALVQVEGLDCVWMFADCNDAWEHCVMRAEGVGDDAPRASVVFGGSFRRRRRGAQGTRGGGRGKGQKGGKGTKRGGGEKGTLGAKAAERSEGRREARGGTGRREAGRRGKGGREGRGEGGKRGERGEGLVLLVYFRM